MSKRRDQQQKAKKQRKAEILSQRGCSKFGTKRKNQRKGIYTKNSPFEAVERKQK